jgi:hypothetical protein
MTGRSMVKIEIQDRIQSNFSWTYIAGDEGRKAAVGKC